jgi:uncharacterized protein YndB with AHSA1/START domain
LAAASFTFTATIPAPMAELFDILSDPARIPEWMPHCHAAKCDGPLRKKSRVTLEFGRRTIELVITAFTAPTTLGWTEVSPRDGAQVFFQLNFGGGTTTLTVKEVWPGSGIRGLWGRLFGRRNAQQRFDGMIQNLRKIATA